MTLKAKIKSYTGKEAKLMGRNAQQNGLRVDDNPFKAGESSKDGYTLCREWFAGYNQAFHGLKFQ